MTLISMDTDKEIYGQV